MSSANKPARRFWEDKPLTGLTPEEWESLCDGCGRCCVIKLEVEDAPDGRGGFHFGGLYYTNIACRLLDDATCRCGSYDLRAKLVKGCVVLSPKTLPEVAHWLPTTCAYRLLHEGQPLADWHPLISGDPESVHRAGISVRGRVVPEYEVAEEDIEDHILDENW